MKTFLSSRERLLCSFRHEQPDHVPLWLLWRNNGMSFNCLDEIGRVEASLEMGVDDSVLLHPPGPREDDLVTNALLAPATSTTMVQHEDGQPYPLITRSYMTTDGNLRQIVRKTDDWPFGGDIPLFTDYSVSRAREHLIKGHADCAALKHILKSPTSDQLKEFKERGRTFRTFAHNKGVLFEGGWTYSADAAVWLVGLDILVQKALEEPDFVQELLEIIYAWESVRINLLIEEKVELITHSAWYEMPYLWSPNLYRLFIKPILMRMIGQCHDAGIPFCYILTAGSSMIIDDLLEMGVDAIRGIDPLMGKNDDLALLKKGLGHRIALWGGVNSAITLGRGSREDIVTAVDQAMDILAPGGGFVLHPVDAIYNDTPMENFRIFIDQWKIRA